VTKGVVERKRADKFKEFFAKRVIKGLEHNCVNVIDPDIDELHSRFRKLHYAIPEETAQYSQA
jgi:hypothetical protein